MATINIRQNLDVDVNDKVFEGEPAGQEVVIRGEGTTNIILTPDEFAKITDFVNENLSI